MTPPVGLGSAPVGARWTPPDRAPAQGRGRSGPGPGAPRTRIGYVIGQLTRGGAERQLYELVRGIDRERVDCVVYCLSAHTAPFGAMLADAGVKVTALSRSAPFELDRVRTLARHVREDRIDILHAFLVHASGYAWLAQRLAGVPRLITSARNCHPAGRLRDWLLPFAFRRSDAIVCNADAVRAFITRRYRAAPAKCHVIHNGVDLTRFPPAAGLPRPRPGDPTRRVMTVGRLVPQKDLGLFLEAAALLVGGAPPTEFLIVGDGPARGELARAAAERGLGATVSFLGERSDVPELLRTADVFWLTSAWEGLPNVLLEAQAAGVPVVTRQAGGAGEVVRHGLTGYVVAGRDPGAFASHTRALLGDPDRTQAMGRAGQELVRERFSVASMVRATERLYGVLHPRPRAPRLGAMAWSSAAAPGIH